MEEIIEKDNIAGDVSEIQSRNEKHNDIETIISQKSDDDKDQYKGHDDDPTSEHNALDSLEEDVKTMDISGSNINEEKKVDDTSPSNESALIEDENTPAKDEKNSEEVYSIFETNAWRGNEKEMFEFNVEKDGCVEIMEALTEDERESLADPNMPLRHLRAEKVFKSDKYFCVWIILFHLIIKDFLKTFLLPLFSNQNQ